MAKARNAVRRTSDETLDEALAVLISSSRTLKRPLPLTEIAKWLDIAVARLGSYAAVAERIGLTTKMLRQFSYVGRLSKTVQRLFAQRKLDSVDAATHLAMLLPDDQRIIAQELANDIIDTSDLRAVVQWRARRPHVPVHELLKGVRASKTHQQYIAEFVIRGENNQAALLRVFRKHVSPEEIVRLDVDGSFGRLVLTRDGKRALAEAAKRLGVPLKRVIPEILYGS